MPRFRPVTSADSSRLYYWRQQAEAAPWYEGERTTRTEHDRWLAARRANALVCLLVWEDSQHVPLGMIRVDSNGELSYYVADKKHAADMLKAATKYADLYAGRLKITLDADDDYEALVDAGFREYPSRSLIYTP